MAARPRVGKARKGKCRLGDEPGHQNFEPLETRQWRASPGKVPD